MHYLLAIDQGTTNSRAIIFDEQGEMISQHAVSLKQSYPKEGWVEQEAEEMYLNSVTCCREAIQKASLTPQQIAAIGISNQRETTIIWDRQTGKPICPAIVWLDRRTGDLCHQLAYTALNQYVKENTGLLFDPYFSATKIMWILEHVPQARERAERGELLFGTVDTFLLWKLTGGKVHATDATNASRTLLFNIKSQTWDAHILSALNIPASLLPIVLDNTADFGIVEKSLLGAPIPISGMAGDQQAATIGQACFQPGMIKVTYGTGCFMLLNTGHELVKSENQLLATIAYRHHNKVTYGLEGSIFSAGIIIKWLRDSLKIISNAAETESLAKSIKSTGGVYLVPAFTGLGAPYWDPHARGSIAGLTYGAGRAEIVRAALESVAYQTCDLLNAMGHDSAFPIKKVRVDGGMVVNDWLMQFLADMLNVEVERPYCIETTALGAAYLAGVQIGMYPTFEEGAKMWKLNASFTPQMSAEQRHKLYQGWQEAVQKVMS